MPAFAVTSTTLSHMHEPDHPALYSITNTTTDLVPAPPTEKKIHKKKKRNRDMELDASNAKIASNQTNLFNSGEICDSENIAKKIKKKQKRVSGAAIALVADSNVILNETPL